MNGPEVREAFLSFFEERGHVRMTSDGLVPAGDDTLLFTGAGMNQFKDWFLGRGEIPNRRVTTCQKCLRAPDLENVGRTPRHHTFFEMLGNFSFGDYFKEETIPWEWVFFTEVLGIKEEHLVISVYREDQDSEDIWTGVVGLDRERIYHFGEGENFWPASAPSEGPNGPCGPCSEIYYDHRPDESLPADEGLEELPEDRFTELGNFVFTQFDRRDGGELVPLPQRNIDVGCGLERITAVLQGVDNDYDTDLFQPYIQGVAARSGVAYGATPDGDVRMRRIADHLRAVVFCITDGALPGNEGRGYVVRKILRRAVRDGYELGIAEPFLFEMAAIVPEVMADVYPEVADALPAVQSVMEAEEEAFRRTYDRGMGVLEDAVGGLDEGGLLDGATAFLLHDTYGFPLDLTRLILGERGFEVDEDGFAAAMAEQRDRARAGSSHGGAVFSEGPAGLLMDREVAPTEFEGYEGLEGRATVVGLFDAEGAAVESLGQDDTGSFAVDATPFYAEGGGQIGDCGLVTWEGGAAEVESCRSAGGYHLHTCVVRDGTLAESTQVDLAVDADARAATARHHTGTHLLHQALKMVLGDDVRQAGSHVGPARLRFDFNFPRALTPVEIARVEGLVLDAVLASPVVVTDIQTLDEARAGGAEALFGEKYGSQVRVVTVGDFSTEVCGGTHVASAGAVGPLRIVSESSSSAGIRRIEAVCGAVAAAAAASDRCVLGETARLLGVPAAEVPQKVAALKEAARSGQAAQPMADTAALAAAAHSTGETVGDVEVFLARAPEGCGHDELREIADGIRTGDGACVILAVSEGDEDVPFVVALGGSAREAGLDAGTLTRVLLDKTGGRGGGRGRMAQGKLADGGSVEEGWNALKGSLEGASSIDQGGPRD